MYVSQREQFIKQKEATAAARDRAAFAFFMEMGTGKTKVAIDEFGRLVMEGKVDDMLLVAPKGVYRNWEREIRLDLMLELLGKAKIVVWRATGGKGQELDIKDMMRSQGPRILIMNTEAFQGVDRAIDLAERFLKDRRSYMVVDESTAIKNPTAKRTLRLINVGRNAAVRRVLTGTPNPRSPLDVFAQFNFLEAGLLGFTNFYSFRSRYAVMRDMDFGGRRVRVVVGHQNTEELATQVARHSYRVLKEDCLDLPPKIYMPIRYVPMSNEQKHLYSSMKEFATAQLADGSHVTATAVITQILRLHQMLCGHTVNEDGTLVSVDSRRLDVLMELLEEAEGKTIIWATYRYNINEIKERLKNEFGPDSVVDYYGGTGDEDRQQAIDRFQNDPACRFFVGNPQTSGRGITLTAARHIIYYANSYDLELRQQSEDRAHRAGLQHSVTYTDLCVEGTVDEKIIDALRKKINLVSLITGDNYREWLV